MAAIMEIRRIKYKSWAELKKQALKYEQLGFICEVKGWADISANVLTISAEEEAEIEKEREDRKKLSDLPGASTQKDVQADCQRS